MYLTVCPLRGPGLIPGHGEIFQLGIVPRLIKCAALYTGPGVIQNGMMNR